MDLIEESKSFTYTIKIYFVLFIFYQFTILKLSLYAENLQIAKIELRYSIQLFDTRELYKEWLLQLVGSLSYFLNKFTK